MDRSLWLLLWLRVRSWFRRIVRNTGTVRGVLLLVTGLLFFCCLFLNPVLGYFLGAIRPAGAHALAPMRRFGPLLILAYCAMTLLFSTGERAILFRPEEVNFLFPGPFGRRQLLAYKVISAVLGCLVTAAFLALVALSWGTWLLAAYAGTVLTLLFLSLFGIAVSLLGNVLGARAYTRRRRVVLGALLLSLLAALVYLGRDLPHLTPGELLGRVEGSPVVQGILVPFGWFVGTFTALSTADLLTYGAPALALDLALAVLVFGLDADYLEASAAASEKVYARIQRIRQAGVSAGWYTTGKGRRVTLPSLPYWGGVGPVAWRQLLAALRSLRGLTIFLAILGTALLVVPVIVFVGSESTDPKQVRLILSCALLGLSLFSLPATLTFDFRGDVDRMDALKALPVAAWRVAIGQLLGVVLLLGTIQLLGLAAIQVAFGGILPLLLGASLLCWPASFLTMGVDNLLFLWFPTRQVVAQPGDFQMMGRQLLLFLARLAVLGVAFGVAGGVGLLPVWLAGWGPLAGVLAATGVLLAFAAALVPLLAVAFDHFDVARDTPP